MCLAKPITRSQKICKATRFGTYVFLSLACSIAMSCNQMDPVSQSKLNEIKSIWKGLPPYPGMVEVDESTISGFGKAYVGKKFRSAASYEDVRRFYSERLPGVGWQIVSDRPLKDWGRDLGGQLLEFRRGEYDISIQYSGQKADYGWEYGISVAWRGPAWQVSGFTRGLIKDYQLTLRLGHQSTNLLEQNGVAKLLSAGSHGISRSNVVRFNWWIIHRVIPRNRKWGCSWSIFSIPGTLTASEAYDCHSLYSDAQQLSKIEEYS